jgi:hypothetical protein
VVTSLMTASFSLRLRLKVYSLKMRFVAFSHSTLHIAATNC